MSDELCQVGLNDPRGGEVEAQLLAEPVPASALSYEEEDYSDEERAEMLALYDGTMKHIEQGEIVTGKVFAIHDGGVIVDIGFKSEGTIPLSEFGDPPNINVGDQIEVYLEDIEDQEGQIVLSKQKADFMRVWDKIKDVYDSGETVEGRLVRRIKGGIVVDLFGVEAFLPGSQIDVKQVKNFDQFIGQSFPFKIIKLNKSRRNIVVSRRALLEEDRDRQRHEILDGLQEGQILEGVVKNITSFGAFVDLGGVDGLLHITDMSWGRVSDPNDVLSIGDSVRVKVLKYEKEKERISLGLKQLKAHPWENVESKYPVGSKVIGKVISLTDYGAFVEIEEGIEGLIHVSEMSWTQHVRHPSKFLEVGQQIDAVVLKIEPTEQKISLGLKQVGPDPWDTLDETFPPGTRLSGKVRNLTSFGAFVEIEEGIDGLVHISDMSWTKRVHHPSEVMKKGQKVDVVVLNVDKKRRRISLGYKQVLDNPWQDLAKLYTPGVEAKGRVSRILDRGVVVDLDGDVEGFIPSSQLGLPGMRKPTEHFQVDDELPLKVIEFNEPQKKIVLSVKEYLKDKEREEVEEYRLSHPARPVTVEEAIGDESAVGVGEDDFASEIEGDEDYSDEDEAVHAAPSVSSGDGEEPAASGDTPTPVEPDRDGDDDPVPSDTGAPVETSHEGPPSAEDVAGDEGGSKDQSG